MSILDEARKMRAYIENMSVNLDDEEALDNIDVFPLWRPGVEYTQEDVDKTRVRYNEVLYKILQPHISQEDWTPDVAVSLYVRVDDPGEEWPLWHQPQGAHDAYEFGAKVSHPTTDRHWISNMNANVFEPGVAGWDEVNEVEE